MKKVKLTKAGKMFFSILIIIIILCIFIAIKSFAKASLHNILEKDNYIIKIDYPDISNKHIKKLAYEFINKEEKKFIANAKKYKVKDRKYDFSSTYSYNKYKDINTLHIVIYYYLGGNHYERKDKIYHYLDDDQIININDILNKNSLNDLVNLSYYYIKKYSDENNINLDDNMIKEGLTANEKTFEYFYLDKSGLVLIFPPYHISSWNFGEIKISIPYNDLKNIIKDKYINKDDLKEEVIVNKTRDISKFKNKKLLAFTFDDGPSLNNTNYLLDNLDKFNARVTFFVLGSRVNQYKDTLTRAYNMGNQIGSHTYNHINLTKIDDYTLMKEIRDTNTNIKNIIGVEPSIIRPPYGSVNNHVKEVSNMYTILWNIDTNDWKYKDKNRICDEIVKNAKDGSIVLLHDLYKTSVEGALLAMEKLYNEGYVFVTIDEMVKIKEIELEKNKTYFNF